MESAGVAVPCRFRLQHIDIAERPVVLDETVDTEDKYQYVKNSFSILSLLTRSSNNVRSISFISKTLIIFIF